MKLFFREFMKWKHLKWFLLFLLCCSISYIGARCIAIEHGPSALPTYHDGDVSIRMPTKNVTYGDYIYIKDVEYPDLVHKRVIAMPGDHLTIHDSVVIINGTKLKENYLAPINRHFSGEEDIVLGEDEYFVMGDNRNHSNDSRNYGPIKKEQITGKTLTHFGHWFIYAYFVFITILMVFPLSRFAFSFPSSSKSETAVNFGSTK